MGRAAHLKLEPGERRVLVLRRHWWLLCRPLLGLIPLLAALPAYAIIEYLAPQADLALYTELFVTVDLLLCGIVALKWLAVDFAGWYADRYILTNRRVIEQQGLVIVERREASLRAIHESNYSISGAEARFFNYGDLTIQTSGRGSGMVFRQIPRPRRIQTVLSAQARGARDDQQRQQPVKGEINAALNRIFNGAAPAHDAPTVAVPRLSSGAIRAARRVALLPDESIVHTTRRHLACLLGGLAPPLGLLAAGLAALIVFGAKIPPPAIAAWSLAVLAWLAWAVFDWLDDLYVLSSDRIIELRRTPLLFELRNVVQLRAVQDVVLRISSISGRFFNLGDLTIQTGGEPCTLQSVPHPDRFQRLIFETLDAAHQRDKLQEQERLAGTLSDWFQEYHRMQSQP